VRYLVRGGRTADGTGDLPFHGRAGRPDGGADHHNALATCVAEQVVGQTGKDLLDEAISRAVTRAATLPII
jgi:hypothetical protein